VVGIELLSGHLKRLCQSNQKTFSGDILPESFAIYQKACLCTPVAVAVSRTLRSLPLAARF
jgi:hypothetical protein